MGTINFTGEEPFYLEALREPTAHAEDDIVIVVLTVCALGLPGSAAEIRLSMAIPHAKQLASKLHPAIDDAARYAL
jgi:hypothetical protein